MLGYAATVYFSVHLGYAFDLYSNRELPPSEMLSATFETFAQNVENNPTAAFFGISPGSAAFLGLIMAHVAAIVAATIYFDKRRIFRHGVEHGSAVFADASTFRKLRNKDHLKNIILTQEVRLSLNHRATRRNLNVMIIGGPGSGKTRFFAKPNLCQLSSSVIITDPKGEVLASTGKMLRNAGYKIKVLNLVDMASSDFYNPFKYLRKDRDEDVLTLITSIVKNTGAGADSKRSSSDPFWENAEALFLQAIFYYIIYEEEEPRQNIGTVIELIRLANFKENEENELDNIFEEVKARSPGHIAVGQYDSFKTSAKETLRSIVITANARFAPFAPPAVLSLFSKDTFELDKLDEQKTAIFVIISPSNTTFNFVGAMFYTQFFAQVDYIANWINPKKNLPQSLRIPVLMILDEFATVGKIPNFEKILAYARSLNVGIFIIVQSFLQLKEMYSEAWEALVDSCDTMLFLGGQSQFTLEYISKKIGKQTIDSTNRSRSYGKQRSNSSNDAILGRELMTPDEIALLSETDALLFIKGFRTYKGRKFDISGHPNYKKLSEDSNFYTHNVSLAHGNAVYVVKFELPNISAKAMPAGGMVVLDDSDDEQDFADGNGEAYEVAIEFGEGNEAYGVVNELDEDDLYHGSNDI